VAGYPRFDVVGQVALVTGAARGLGRAVTLALANAGADVALGLRDLSSDAGLVAEIEATGRQVLPVQCEVGDIGQVQAAVEAVVTRFGRLDVLVNNAGVAPGNEAMDVSVEVIDRSVTETGKGRLLERQ
jgi:NAD(P)-dependent dehydrogenase (short-subunit alcohol dehydrogenase family)